MVVQSGGLDHFHDVKYLLINYYYYYYYWLSLTFSQPISGFINIWAAGGEIFLLLWCSYRKSGQFSLGPRRKAQHKEQQTHTHKSPFRPSLQRIERWHIVQPLNFVVTKSHGAGKLLTCLHSSAASSLHSLHACVHGNVACHPSTCCTLGQLSNHLGC